VLGDAADASRLDRSARSAAALLAS
jgi:hypothetical protein